MNVHTLLFFSGLFICAAEEADNLLCDDFVNGIESSSHCTVSNVSITNEKQLNYSVITLNQRNQVTWMSFVHSELHKIPTDLFQYFCNLQCLLILSNKIKVLDASSLANATQLRQLQLGENEIQIIHKNAFYYAKDLEAVNLFQNKIHKINDGIFDHNAKLSWIILDFNELEHIDLNVFRNQISISVYLNSNRIKTLDQIDMEKIPNITQLELNNNQLENIENISNLRRLIILDISSNPLKTLHRSIFLQLKELNKLYLSNTQLTHLPIGIFDQLQKLQILDLSQNYFQEIDLNIFITPLNELEQFFINRNHLKEIIGLTLIKEKFPLLREISVLDNNWDTSSLLVLSKTFSENGITEL